MNSIEYQFCLETTGKDGIETMARLQSMVRYPDSWDHKLPFRSVEQNGHGHLLRQLLMLDVPAPDCALIPPPRPRTFCVGFDALAEGLVKRLGLRAARRFLDPSR